jgi:cytidyltransferase-like protein
MKILSEENIYSLKKYKYICEDNFFLNQLYTKFWIYLQSYIPRKIHPNILTLMGLISVILSYILNKNNNYSNIIMAIGIFNYINYDGIDGIHARNTKQTSIIGEYMDRLIDLCVAGLIGSYIFNMFGITDNITKNLLIFFVSFEFIFPHLRAIQIKKIIFDGTANVSLVTTTSLIITLINMKLPIFLINNNWIILLICSGLFLFKTYSIYKNILSLNDSNDNLYKKYYKIYLLYWLIKLSLTLLIPVKYSWSLSIIDLIILVETINIKIFSSRLISDYFIILPLGLYFYSNTIGIIWTILFICYFIYKISKQLKINLFQNHPSQYLHRVYCCGVFDLCHLGHMKLFEKIKKSFDHPIWLIVGVHSDETVKSYKREPIINECFRIETVKLCKYVDEVLPGAELIVTKEFCIENQIDCVIIGEEYKGTKDSIWYAGGIELSIHKYISRFEEISSSDIIKKIKENE